jgi:outer membrane receptor protein involved in Fe transport
MYVLGTTLSALLFSVSLCAQTDTGRILGSVLDQSQGVVVGAALTIMDTQRGITRNLTSNDSGEYLVPNLLPGIYSVRVSAPGFRTAERRNVELQVAQDVRIDFVLQPGEMQQTVTVTEEAPLVDLTSAVLGGTLSNVQINEMPLNGRNFMNLLQLRPGVMIMPGGGKWSQTTNGLRVDHNVYIVDGIDSIEGFSSLSVVNGNSFSGDTSSSLPIDAIQEFNLQQNPKAEYGWKPGAIVNIGVKSGTNQLHGTAYAFGRDSALDATNPFIPAGQPKQVTHLEQFGATAGGPIKKDKHFYFGAYEGQRELIGAPQTYQVPTTASFATPASPNGDVTNSLTDACKSVVKTGRSPSPLSLAMAGLDGNCQVVSPKQNLFQDGLSISYVPIIPLDTRQDNVLAKTDYRINDRHTLSGEYYYSNYRGLGTQNQIHDYWRASNVITSQIAGAHWTWIPKPTLVNEVRFGMNRVYQFLGSGECQAGVGPDTSYLHTGAQSCGFPQIVITGFTSLGGNSNFPKLQGPDNTFQFLDDVSYNRGKHAFKFGAEFRRMKYHGGTFRYGKGNIVFRSSAGSTPLQSFISGTPSKESVFVGDPVVNITDWGYAGFFQDDWRVTPRWTLNLGLRYEFVTPIKEANNLLANFDPERGMVQVGKGIDTPYQPQTKNFSPRLGFAWDITGSGRTVLRGGAAIIYALQGFNVLTSQQGSTAVTTGLNTSPTGALLNGVPGPGNITAGGVTLTDSKQLKQTWTLAGPIFPAGQITCTTAGPCPILAVDPNLSTPYVTSWNIGIQHALTRTLGLDVSYVGNHGSKMTSMVDINPAALGSGWSGNPASAAENASRPYFKQFPYLSNINQIQNADRSNYNGLQATLTERPAHGLDFTVGYTYSHALDMLGRDWLSNVPMYSPNPKLDYASSQFDVRHRLTAATTYALPQKKWRAQMLEGWQLNSIVNLATGAPWAVIDSTTDVSGTGEFADRWNFFGNPSDFSYRGSTPIPWFPADSNPACLSQAPKGSNAYSSLVKWGCFVSGNSMMLPPALGTLGTMGRNIFRDNGLYLWDLSVTKKWKLTERLSAQFRAEFFNILNTTAYASPAMATTIGAGQHNNPTTTSQFGTSLTTPDVQNANPQIGSGAARSTQLGFKLIF